MLADILYYAKDRESEYETLDIHQFMMDVASGMESKARSFNVDFEYNLTSASGEFVTDQTAMRSALVNILENAFDACRKDLSQPTHLVTFNVAVDEDEESIIIDIIDDGIGMDRETQEKIFSLFFSSKGQEGTGLGLFISNKIIKEHNGTINVNSQPGQGVHFRIVLPQSPDIED